MNVRSMARRRFVRSAVSMAMVAGSTRYALAALGTKDLDGRPFNAQSTAEDVTAGLNLDGKTILVTGCNSGLGLETMRVLAMRGAHVLGTARTSAKAERACASVEGHAAPYVIELSDYDSVVACAEQVRAKHEHIDAVICNAAVMGIPEL